MNWRRIGVILRFDLRHGALNARGLVFLVPFLLFWYFIIHSFNQDVSSWLSEREGIMLLGTLFDPAAAAALFIDHPPLLSVFFLLALSTAPVFAMLAAFDQFSSDIGSGYFRLLSTRCRRMELFAARYLAALSLLITAHAAIGAMALWVSIYQDGYEFAVTFAYLGQILLTILIYLCPFVAYMALVSALTRSAMASLVLGMVGYVVLLGAVWLGNVILPGTSYFNYLLPSALKYQLFGADVTESIAAIAGLPLYTLAYGWAAWTVFRSRNF